MSTEMQCPQCYAGLDRALAGIVEIDGCRQCGGLWFDAEELGHLARDAGDPLWHLEHTFEPAARQIVGEREQYLGARLCPACRVPMKEFEYPWAPGIHLDGCPKCKGLWVDDGELAEIDRMVTRARARRGGPQPGARASQPPVSSTAAPASSSDQLQRARLLAAALSTLRCLRCGTDNMSLGGSCRACGEFLQVGGPSLLCPHCHGALTRVEAGSLAIDGCGACGGIWLDAGEVTALLALPPAQLTAAVREITADGSLTRPLTPRAGPLRCPGCHASLTLHTDTERTGARVETCTGCRGLWVWISELPGIYAYFAGRR
jgi:Zn-finger nucleic acid-binding protein